MDELKSEFLDLISNAVNILTKLNNDFSKKYKVKNPGLSQIENTLLKIRQRVINDELPRKSKGENENIAGLGLARGAGEFFNDKELMDVLYKIDDFFGNNY